MSFNLPANRLLKLTKGHWRDVQYPAHIVVQADLAPRDFFEPVPPEAPRSCVPAGGKNFSYFFDSNSGKMTLRGETVFPPLSVTFSINDEAWHVVFVGRCMQVTQMLGSEDDIDALLTNVEQTLPSLLSVKTGLSIFCESIEIALGDQVEARAEALIPPTSVRVIDSERRVAEIQCAIEMIGMCLSSARLTLASSYLREALFFEASYHDHNPYTLSLLAILKCAQAIEVLFGSKRDHIRDACRALSIDHQVIETQIIPIVIARNSLGPAHASAFVPTPRQSDILRRFAHRSTHTVRELLLHIHRRPPPGRNFLDGPIARDSDKDKLLNALENDLRVPMWCVDGDLELREVSIPDPRLGPIPS